jgi:MFS family permease
VTGIGRYRALMAIDGVRAPLVLSTAGSMPIGMYMLGILLLAHEVSGSFALAGRVVGAFSLANALGATAQGRLMDRFGQTRVLRVAAFGHLPALIALVIAARADASTWVLAGIALCGGLTLPQLPAAMRSLWNALVEDPEQRATAYALVAVVFEVAVVTAPAIVAGIVALSTPAVAVVIAGALGTGSALGFTQTKASRRWRGEQHDIGWLGPLAAPGMRTVFAVLAVFGSAVGIVQVAVPAFADERGSAAAGGILLAALSAGSLVGGVVYGARTWRGAPPTRLTLLMLVLGGAFALLALAQSAAVLAVLLVLCGALFAPTTVVGSTLLDTVAPAGTVTEGFAAMVMGIVAGTALGNALGGALVESSSYATSVLVAGAIAAGGSLLALTRRRTLA